MRPVSWGATVNVNRNFSYSFNELLRQRPKRVDRNGNPRLGVNRTDIVQPEHKILLVEEEFPNDACCYLCWPDANGNPQFDSDDQLAQRHTHRGNQGFADGHVECLTAAAIGYADKMKNVPINTAIALTYGDLFNSY